MDAADGSGTTVIGQHFSNNTGGGYGATLLEWDGQESRVRYFDTSGTARYTLNNDPLNSEITPGTGGGVEGRLARPRRVELWRSQGETQPTLTVANRYVDPTSGNDSNNGLTPSTAWKTMGKAFTATHGLGVGIGYLSGNLHNSPQVWDGVAGSGNNFLTGMNTHYVLDGHTCTVNGNFFSESAIHIKHMSYLQFSGFTMVNNDNRDGGADWAGGIQVDDIPDQNTAHHIIWADLVTDSFNGSGVNGYGVRYARILACDVYDSGWWHGSGGSGMTMNNIDASTPTDTEPAGYIDGNPIDIWIEACYVTGSRQKVDSADIGYPGEIVDGNAIILDYNVGGPTVRGAVINCITHNTGQRGIHSFEGVDELWVVNCASYYSGRHRVYVADSGDPVFGLSPKAAYEIMVSSYAGRTLTAYVWNSVAICGAWMTAADRAFAADGANAVMSGSNNFRYNAPATDSYSSVLSSAPNIVDDSLDGRVFDPRPNVGSPMLTGGDLSLLALTGVTTDFAGNAVASSGTGHVGPYSEPVLFV